MALLAIALAACAEPSRLEVDVRLDPATRELAARAQLSGLETPLRFRLDPALRITRLVVDGQAQPLPPAGAMVSLPAGRRLSVEYSGRLAPLPEADHRQVLGRLPPSASPAGSFLPAGTGWYPDPGVPFAYRLRLTLPKGQKGLVPGNRLREVEDAKGYRAEFDFPHPAEGIDLMAGPYTVSERILTLEDGRRLRVRTWFHPELADLAADYLADSARYIERYSRLIGPYPFDDFGVVSSPLPTGYGMASLTYLGREVLRLPFIRSSSLGHEVLHNWWGNGVYPDWGRGNWSEGLTTFLADYAFKEDEGEAAAREMRLAWLRDLIAVPEAEDRPLTRFTARTHGIASVIGYNKSAMVFLMLRDEIGREAFEKGLRLIWARHRFRTAGWADLERAWSEAAGRDLAPFFRQWVERAGAPRLRLEAAEQAGGRLQLTLTQAGEPFALKVPIALRIYPDRIERRVVSLDAARATVGLPVNGLVQAVELDPDFRLWRRLDPAVLPPILREVFIAPQTGIVLADEETAWQTAARQLAGRVLDHAPRALLAQETPPADLPLLILGSPAAVERSLLRLDLAAPPARLQGQGTAQVWAGRDVNGRPYAVARADSAESLSALQRALPHYGRQSWLVFEAGRVRDKSTWPARAERIRVTQRGG